MKIISHKISIGIRVTDDTIVRIVLDFKIEDGDIIIITDIDEIIDEISIQLDLPAYVKIDTDILIDEIRSTIAEVADKLVCLN